MKEYNRKVRTLYHSQGGRCESCDILFTLEDKKELAHKIPAYEFNYKEYGEDVIDHIFNLALTHTGKCNDDQNLSLAAHPIQGKELIQTIKNDILTRS